MPVRAIAFSPSGRHAVSAAASERSVSVWNTSGSKKSKKLGGVAVANLDVEDAAVTLCTCSAASVDEDGSFYAAAVTEAGEAYVWLCIPEGETAVVVTLAARVRVGQSKVAPGTGAMGSRDLILAAGLEAAGDGATLVAVRGNSAKPTFERIAVSAPQPGQQHQKQQQQQQHLIHLEPSPGGALMREGKQQQASGKARLANGPAAGADVEMLGPENDGALVRPRAAAAAAGGKKRLQPEGDDEGEALLGDAEDDAAAAASSSDDDDEGLVEGEQTLGERVAALERQQAAAAAGPSGADDDAAAAAAAAGAALLEGPVKADSLAVLLQQALRSGDKALLERCLGLSDARVVRNSVRRLLPMDAAALLRACVERLQSRPVRGQQLAAWIRAVLLHHTAYLMAAPGVQPVLTSLYQTIEARLAMQRTLLSLSGRLDLLLAQSGPGSAGAGDDGEGGAGAGAARPHVAYEESGSEDGGAEVDVEDAFAPRGGSSEEDDDDDEDEDMDEEGDDDDDEGDDDEDDEDDDE